MHPKALLFILVGVIPLVVAGAGFVSFVLLRAGYGVFVGGVVPFVAALLLAAALGALLGRAASGRRGPHRDRPQDKEPARSRGQDDV